MTTKRLVARAQPVLTIRTAVIVVIFNAMMMMMIIIFLATIRISRIAAAIVIATKVPVTAKPAAAGAVALLAKVATVTVVAGEVGTSNQEAPAVVVLISRCRSRSIPVVVVAVLTVVAGVAATTAVVAVVYTESSSRSLSRSHGRHRSRRRGSSNEFAYNAPLHCAMIIILALCRVTHRVQKLNAHRHEVLSGYSFAWRSTVLKRTVRASLVP